MSTAVPPSGPGFLPPEPPVADPAGPAPRRARTEQEPTDVPRRALPLRAAPSPPADAGAPDQASLGEPRVSAPAPGLASPVPAEPPIAPGPPVPPSPEQAPLPEPASTVLAEAPAGPTAPQTRRPHPLTPLVRGWVVLLPAAYSLLRDWRPGSADDRWWVYPLLVLGVSVALAVVAGLASWWFTRFVVDAHEVRVETGWLNRQTKQIAVDRIQSVDLIQPLAARLLGLCELKIDVGADAATRLRYLSRKDGYAIRDQLLAHAHGDALAPGEAARTVGRLTDRADDEETLVTVGPVALAISAFFSTELLAGLVIAGLMLWAATGTAGMLGDGSGGLLVGAAGALPVLLGTLKVVSDRVIGQWGYRLAISPRGLKISRGLTSLTSQSVPVHRIQGLALRQPLLWRPFGLYRVDVDVLGYGHATGDEDDSGTSTILLPAGTARDVAVALAHTMPDLDLAGLIMHSSPRRARWFHPFGWRGQRWGATERHLVSESGVLSLRGEIVPHARVQSMELAQGPLDQRLGLASVQATTPDGPVSLWIRDVDLADALALVPAELERARACRADEVARLGTGRRALA